MTNSAIRDLMPSLPQLWVLHYLYSESEVKHVAHCLDRDLVSAGESVQEAGQKLDDLVKAHVEYSLATGQLTNLATRAPASYWKLFLAGRPVELEPKKIQITVPEAMQVVPLGSSEGEIGILARQQLGHAA